MKAVMLAGAAILSAAFLIACGGDDDESAVTVKGFEYGYDMPTDVEGGLVKMTFENTGAEPHEFALAKLDDGKTAADLRANLDKRGGGEEPPAWVQDIGGISPMTAGAKIGITRELRAGNYAFICFLPTPEGEPHYKLGMIKGFKVSGDNGEEAPETDASITATDTAFEVSKLEAGEKTIELGNEAEQPRGFILLGLKPGKTVQDIDKWFNSGLTGEAPADIYGTMQSIPPGQSDFLDIELESGKTYLIIDPDHGIQKTFKVG